MRNVLVTGQISRWIKEMIFAAISKDRNCHYCAATHLTCCRMLGVNPVHLDSLVRDVTSITDTKLRDMILFAVKCSREPQSLTKPTLKSFGYMASVSPRLWKYFRCRLWPSMPIIADATGMDADDMFAGAS